MLKDKIDLIPTNSGVYQYYDRDNRLLYVGKAKNLKNRVKSYFNFNPLSPSKNLSPRIYHMVSQIENIEYIILDNERDALILENSLIKQLKPKYNILLRDDKTYPYIYIDTKDDFPRFEITRKLIESKSIIYFGPYISNSKEILDAIYELIPLVQKRSCLKLKKSCLFFQIGRCMAPCENLITKDEYSKLVKEAIELLKEKNKLINRLTKLMFEFADKLLFEEASRVKSIIKSINKSNI